MRLTTKGRFAVTAMLDLALREHAGPVTLAGISEREHISLSYLEQLFGKLRRKGLVESTRGPGGGYTLGKPAAEIQDALDDPRPSLPHDEVMATMDAVIEAVEREAVAAYQQSSA